jgi:D-galactonate transporter
MIAPAPSSPHEEALYRKVTRRLIPFLFLCYVLAFLDRVNVGFAKLHMLADLGFSDTVYGLGAGIFFIGYFLFEVPSNLLLEKLGARIWIARIMITWGLISAAMMFVRTPGMFYFLRFLLGVAEAGFFPGIILYLTYWYPAARRGRIIALFMTAIPVAGVIGSPLSGWIMQAFHGLNGWAGWQWLFLMEGLPSVFVGISVLFVLRDGISGAGWLSPEEKRLLQSRLDAGPVSKTKRMPLARWLVHPRLLFLSLIYFCISMGLYGAVSFWLPQLVKNSGFVDPLHIGLLTAVPYLCAIPAMWWLSRSSDRRGERRWHFAFSAGCGGAGLLLSVLYGAQPFGAIASLSLASAGILAALPVFWSMTTSSLSGGAAAGIAVINSIGGLAGFTGPYMMGWIRDATGGSLDTGMYLIAGFLLLGGLLALRVIPRTASA